VKTLLAALATLALASCTFVYIRGNENALDDVGGHGGGLEFSRSERKPLADLIHPATPAPATHH
jgi:hypothetical protein